MDVETLGRFQNKFAGAKTHKRWPEALRLMKAGKQKEAEALARAILNDNPGIKINNAIAVRKRRLRTEHFAAIDDFEYEYLRPLFRGYTAKLVSAVMKASDRNMKIPPRQLKPLNRRLRDYTFDHYGDFRVEINRAVRQSIKRGIIHDMRSTQRGLDLKKQKGESDADYEKRYNEGVQILEDKADIKITGHLFQSIYDSVKKARLKRGFTVAKTPTRFQSGYTVSAQVWDLRDETLRKIKRRLNRGIASGESATTIAADLKRYTKINALTKEEIKALRSAGVRLPRGSYWSSYKTAMRMVRTEMNIGYVEAELEYARRKGYKKMWNIAWPDACPLCTPLDGKIFPPGEAPFPQHPNDACYLTTHFDD